MASCHFRDRACPVATLSLPPHRSSHLRGLHQGSRRPLHLILLVSYGFNLDGVEERGRRDIPLYAMSLEQPRRREGAKCGGGSSFQCSQPMRARETANSLEYKALLKRDGQHEISYRSRYVYSFDFSSLLKRFIPPYVAIPSSPKKLQPTRLMQL